MKLRVISPTVHGLIDYSAGLGLIALPFVLGLGEVNPIAKWASVSVGIAVLVVSSMTNYKYCLARVIPFDGHLAIDLLAATTFMILPFVLDLQGLDAQYYWFNAAVVYLVVALSESNSIINKQEQI